MVFEGLGGPLAILGTLGFLALLLFLFLFFFYFYLFFLGILAFPLAFPWTLVS